MELDEKYREAIYLHYYEGYSIAEIAAITNRTASAVAAHLSRGRTKLRTALGEKVGELRFRSERKHSRRRQPHDRKKAHTTCA